MNRLRRMGFQQWVLFAVLMVLPLAFQNCGNGGYLNLQDPGAMESSSFDAFFDYSYPSKPDYFINHQFLIDPSGAKFSTFDIFIALTPASGVHVPVAWQLRMLDASGQPICADESGTLQAGQTAIQSSCTPGAAPSSVMVELTFTPQGAASRTLTWQY